MKRIWTQKPPLGVLPNFGHSLSRGLVGAWFFNEGSGNKVYDLSGNRNTGVFVGNIAWDSGKFGSVLISDGIGDYVNCGANNIIISDLTDVTVNIWLYITSTTATYSETFTSGSHIVSSQPNAAGWVIWCSYQSSNIKFSVAKSNTVRVTTPTKTLSLNTWYMVTGVFVKATSTAYLYVDGVLIGSATNINVDAFAGSVCNISASTYGVIGKLDVPMIYNRALSPSEIALLYREPFRMFERDPIELWSAATLGAAPPAGIPILRRRIEAA